MVEEPVAAAMAAAASAAACGLTRAVAGAVSPAPGDGDAAAEDCGAAASPEGIAVALALGVAPAGDGGAVVAFAPVSAVAASELPWRGTRMRLAPNWRIWAFIWAGMARHTAARQNRVAAPTAEEPMAARARERRRARARPSMMTNMRRLVMRRRGAAGVVVMAVLTSCAGPWPAGS